MLGVICMYSPENYADAAIAEQARAVLRGAFGPWHSTITRK